MFMQVDMHPETYDFSNEKIKAVVRIFNLGARIACLYISHNSYIYVYVCVRLIELKEIKKWSLKIKTAT